MAQGATSAPIWPLISDAVENSVILAVITALLMIPLSLGLGVLAAVLRGRWLDHVISVASLAAIALPEFVIGSLLVGVFFVGLDWLPPVAIVAPGANPLDHPAKLVLPIATLLLASLAAGVRMVRAGMVEVLQTEYVQTARLNGVSERRVLWRYALRNALPTSVQILAQNLQWLIGGIIITENVFAYPGIGSDARDRRREPRPHARDVGRDADRGRVRAAQSGRRPARDAARPEAAGARMTGRLRFLRSFSGALGAGIVVFVVLVALFGRYLAPHDPSEPIGVPLSDASSNALLGTDFLGRDVFSRLLYGGRSVILVALAATLLAYAVGLAIGLIAGYSRSLVDPLLMRSVDVLLAFPPLLLLLILITGAGHGRRRPDRRRRASSRRRPSAASSGRPRRSRPCAPTWRPRSRAASARSRSSGARCCRTSSRRCSSTRGCASRSRS